MKRFLIVLAVCIPLALWCCLVLIPFFSINGTSFQPLLWSLHAITVAVWFWVFIAALGWKISQNFELFKSHPDSPLRTAQSMLLSLGIGLGAFAAAVLLTGCCLGVSSRIMFLMLSVLTILIGRTWVDFFRACHALWNQIRSTEQRTMLLLACSLGGVAFLVLPWALTPTLFPDTLRYHFGLTRLFEQVGKIRFLKDFAEAGLASNWQMIFMPQLLLGNGGCAMVFNWIALPLTALTVAAAVPRSGRLLSGLTVITTPFLLGVSALGNNDLGVALFAALACLALKHRTGRAPFLIAGILAGFAVGTKYTALPPVLFLLLVSALLSPQARDKTSSVLWAGIGLSIGYVPWFIRNVIWTGDPFYPTLSAWLPWGTFEGRWVVSHYRTELTHYGQPHEGWLHALLAPLEASIADPRYHESDLGLIFWCLAPWVIYICTRSRTNASLLTTVIVVNMGGFIWSAGAHVTRFLAPIVPIAAIAIGEAWHEWTSGPSHRRSRMLVIPFLAILMGMNVWQTLTSMAGFAEPYAYLLGGMTRQTYLYKQSASYRTAQWLEQNCPPGERVLLLGEENLYFFRIPIQTSGPFDRKWIVSTTEESHTPAELTNRLQEKKIAYICFQPLHMNGMDQRFGYLSWPSPQVRERFETWLKSETDLIRKDQDVELRRVRFH